MFIKCFLFGTLVFANQLPTQEYLINCRKMLDKLISAKISYERTVYFKTGDSFEYRNIYTERIKQFKKGKTKEKYEESIVAILRFDSVKDDHRVIEFRYAPEYLNVIPKDQYISYKDFYKIMLLNLRDSTNYTSIKYFKQ